jgi:hypothetical protein
VGQVLHGSATTTHVVRAAIQRSKASLQTLSERYGINPKTVAKWRRRVSKAAAIADGRITPHHTVLIAVAFTFLQLERLRSDDDTRPSHPTVRFWVREIMAVLYVVSNRKLLNLLASFQRNPPLRR